MVHQPPDARMLRYRRVVPQVWPIGTSPQGVPHPRERLSLLRYHYVADTVRAGFRRTLGNRHGIGSKIRNVGDPEPREGYGPRTLRSLLRDRRDASARDFAPLSKLRLS